jgi:hypothetical protein
LPFFHLYVFFLTVFLAQILYLNTQPPRYLFYLIEALEVRLGHKVKVVCEDGFFCIFLIFGLWLSLTFLCDKLWIIPLWSRSDKVPLRTWEMTRSMWIMMNDWLVIRGYLLGLNSWVSSDPIRLFLLKYELSHNLKNISVFFSRYKVLHLIETTGIVISSKQSMHFVIVV